MFLRYGRGKTPSGILNGDVCPAITTSAWQSNNFLIIPIMESKILSSRRTELAKQFRREGVQIESDQVIGSMQAHAYRGSTDGPAPCINAAAGMGGGHIPMVVDNNDNWGESSEISRTLEVESPDYSVVSDYRIRRLTPREVLRLMDVYDDDIDRLFASGLSDNALYELAGNSIVVHCLYLIFRNMLISEFMAQPTAPPPKQLSLFAGLD